MIRTFTTLIPVNTQRSQSLSTTFLLLLLLSLFGVQEVWGQEINSIDPKCATVGESFNLTVSGSGFSTATRAQVRGTGAQVELTRISVSSTTVQFVVPATALTTSGDLDVRIGNANAGGKINFDNLTPRFIPVYAKLNAGNITPNTAVCVNTTGAIYSIPAVAGANSYLWQVSGPATITAGGTTNQVTVDFGSTAGTVTLRARVLNQCDFAGTESTLSITVDPTSVGGTIDPLTTSVCTGSGTELEVKNYTGTIVTWQSTTNNGDESSWTDIAGSANASNLSTEELTTATYFRAVVQSGTCAVAYSTEATVSIDQPSVGGTANAINGTASICAGSESTIELIGYTGSIVRWEQSVNDGPWTTISSTANSYATGPLSANTSFRAVVKNGACTEATSSEAQVTVDQSAKGGTAQAKTSPICSGSTAEIGLSGQTGTITRWQKRTEGSTTWTDIISTANPYFTEELTATTYFRAEVKNGGCTDFSSEATVTVDQPSVGGTAKATAAAVCAGTETRITLSDHTGTIVKWQQSTDGTTWNDIASTANPYPTGNLSTATSFRAVVKNGVCTEDTSSEATVSITPTVGTPSFTGSPDANRCSGPGTTTYTATADYATSYKWSIFPETAGTIDEETGTVTWNEAFGSQSGENASITVTAYGVCGKKSTTFGVRSVTSPTANAGVDQAKCSDPNVSTTFTLNGTANFASDDRYGNRRWTIVSLNGLTEEDVTITNPGDLKSTVVINGIGSVVLRLTASRTEPISCAAATDEVVLTVNQNPEAPTVPILEERTTFYTGEEAFNFVGNPAGGAFSLKRLSDNQTFTLANGYFDPCNSNYGAGDYTLTYTYTDGNTCKSSVEYAIKINTSKYQVVLTTSQYPICRGDNVTYIATVYRDAEKIVYPYKANEYGQPVDADDNVIEAGGTPILNEDYFTAAELEDLRANQPLVLANAWRFFEPRITLGSGEQVDPSNFTYQFVRYNGSQISDHSSTSGSHVIDNASLSASDWVGVKISSTKTCPVIDYDMNEKKVRPKSHWVYLGDPAGYTMDLAPTNAFCNNYAEGEMITLTATAGDQLNIWNDPNLELELLWYRIRGTEAPFLIERTDFNDENPFVIEVAKSLFQDGDEVFVDFNTTLDTYFDEKCSKDVETVSNTITISIDEPATITQALQLTDPALCSGTGETIYSVVATGTDLIFTWYKEGSTTPVANSDNISISTTNTDGSTTSSLTITDPTLDNAGNYYVTVANNTQTAACAITLTTASAELTVNPTADVDLSSLTVCELDEKFELTLGSATINGSTPTGGSFTYSGVGVTKNDEDGKYYFDPSVAGAGEITYTYKTAENCTSSITETVITVTKAAELEGKIEVWGNEDPEMWELRAVDITPGIVTGTTYYWYVGESKDGDPVPADGWKLMATTTEPTYLVEAPEAPASEDIRYRVIVNSPDDECIKDLVLEIREPVDVLPVIMLYFNAEVQQDNVVLRWATGQEQNNTGFEVQLSTNGTTYRTLAFVETENGNSSAIQTYNYTDSEYGKHGIRYYRLKQIDVDGQFEFFGPVSADFGSRNTILVSPNPFIDKLGVSIETEKAGLGYVTLTNALGIQLLKRSIAVEKGVNLEELQINSALPGGIYYITIQVGDITKQYKVLKHE